jgi:hypothetical protein
LAADETSKELERIAKRVENLVDEGKGLNPKYLVSALGIALGDDLKILKELTHRGLNDFIESHLSHRFTLERTGIHGNITAVVDKSVNSATPPTLESRREQSPRFHPRFWAAFSVPAKADHVRIFNVDTVSFEDLPNTEVRNGDLTIAENLIVPAGDDRRDEKIKANIASWLEKNGLSADRFQASKRAHSRTSHQQNGSLLNAIIAALDHRQLQSTNLTLDVVAALLRTPRE